MKKKWNHNIVYFSKSFKIMFTLLYKIYSKSIYYVINCIIMYIFKYTCNNRELNEAGKWTLFMDMQE